MYSERKKNIENSEAPSSRPETLAPVSVLRRKILKGTSGAVERSSIATKIPIRATDPASRLMILVEPQPELLASRSAYASRERPAVMLTAPAASKWRVADSERLSPIKPGVSARAIAATGTFTQRTHSQPRPSVRMPPSRTPAAPAEPATAPQTPSALLRSEPSLKVVVTIDRAAGETSAAPSPCTER